jgi:hypothetical protein
MIDERFSATAFERSGLDSESAKVLCDALEMEIQQLLHSIVSEKLNEIVEQLNTMGHRLRFYEPPRPGDIAYRDDWVDEQDEYHCRLRVACDTVISTGYAHLWNPDDGGE